MSPALRNIILLASTGAGYLVAHVTHLHNLTQDAGYGYIIAAILVLGLYASTTSIEIDQFRDQLSVILLALTVGVFAKAALIAGVMYLVFHTPSAMLLGVAVAQIDPLSVIAMNRRSAMSERAKALLTAWASFDDPITVLLTIYVATFAAPHATATRVPTGSLGLNLAASVVLTAVAVVVWRVLARRNATTDPPSAFAGPGRMVGAALVATITVAKSLLLAPAVIGMFVRPRSRALLDGATELAVYAACFTLGLVLVGPYHLTQGVVLGGAAYLAHALVAALLTIRQRGDRVRLMLGQQNGLTAILLGLLLEPAFPGATSTIAVAVLVIAVLNGACNRTWDRIAPPAPASTVPVPV
jgi:NhaP-type Na+/H+ or K+/H+ antiporter